MTKSKKVWILIMTEIRTTLTAIDALLCSLVTSIGY